MKHALLNIHFIVRKSVSALPSMNYIYAKCLCVYFLSILYTKIGNKNGICVNVYDTFKS